jgi:hypothetical protein
MHIIYTDRFRDDISTYAHIRESRSVSKISQSLNTHVHLKKITLQVK